MDTLTLEQLTIDHKNGHTTTYKLLPCPGQLPIAYHTETSEAVVNILEHARTCNIRLVLDYGDIVTGQSWGEDLDIKGYIRLSRGAKARFPILLYNNKSIGGPAILDHCIVRISNSKGGGALYEHPTYKQCTDKAN